MLFDKPTGKPSFSNGAKWSLPFFEHIERARFVSRENRFTINCKFKGRNTKVFLPNPGRLWELLLPGTPISLSRTGNPNRTLRFTAVGAERYGHPIVLHTHRTNDIAQYLIENKLIPGLKAHRIAGREVTRGRSRFDFLLNRGREELLLEVKSCTLFSRRLAMFPDAVTERGRRHLEELAELSRPGVACAALFLIHYPSAEVFLPDFHTDLDFAKTMYSVKDRVLFFPVSVRWRHDFALDKSSVNIVDIPWETVEREVHDRGSYLLLLRLDKKTDLPVGALGTITFHPGYYIYIGSARKHLSKRIERHKRLRKNKFWHIDYLREKAQFYKALPIRTADDLECEIASAIKGLADHEIPGFGSSDCRCPSHLFRMPSDPLISNPFHEILQSFRMERLLERSET